MVRFRPGGFIDYNQEDNPRLIIALRYCFFSSSLHPQHLETPGDWFLDYCGAIRSGDCFVWSGYVLVFRARPVTACMPREELAQ
jgi:hypothetical protein